MVGRFLLGGHFNCIPGRCGCYEVEGADGAELCGKTVAIEVDVGDVGLGGTRIKDALMFEVNALKIPDGEVGMLLEDVTIEVLVVEAVIDGFLHINSKDGVLTKDYLEDEVPVLELFCKSVSVRGNKRFVRYGV